MGVRANSFVLAPCKSSTAPAPTPLSRLRSLFRMVSSFLLERIGTKLTSIDMAGLGEYHFSLQKNPVGTAAQPTGIKEAIIFGGIFMEDSTNGQVTLQ